MTDKQLSTESYKGVRDFYPADAAIQQYIFNTWAQTAESFGFERYDASILEPADLYKAKGVENEEMVNEQTYTFTDRGDREVTLRPEMTPTVARMVAGKARELVFPLRWYSIPNLFRYERPQKGRLREHWQLNCDMFGSSAVSADIEVIALAAQVLKSFGATDDQFEIQLNNRQEMAALYTNIGITDPDTITTLTRLADRKKKLSTAEYETAVAEILPDQAQVAEVIALVEDTAGTNDVLEGLRALGITNARIDRTIARGFDYYTGTVFEIFAVDADGSSTGRSMIGGGRYDNLTGMFGGEPISGIGFGMGDVTMRDFLEAHDLIPESVRSTATKVTVIPETAEQNLFAQAVAKQIRDAGISVTTDIGTQKPDKKKARAQSKGSAYIIEVGENQTQSGILTIKNLATSEGSTGPLAELLPLIQ